MNLFQKRKTKKRMEKLWGLCEYHIMEYEKRCSYTVPSCLPDLKKQIWKMINFYADEIRDWNDDEVDYDKISHSLISHSSFDLLTSGKYHMYYGMLNSMSCAPKMKFVYKSNMEYCFSIGEVTKEEMEEQFQNLDNCIKHVG